MQAAVADMLTRLSALPDGAEYDLEVEMTHVTADIIFRTIFSMPMAQADAKRIFTEFASFQAIAPRLLMPTIYGLRWLVWPWDVWRSRRAALTIRHLLGQLIRPRFDAQRTGQLTETTDILQSFLDAKDEATGKGFDFEELLDQVAMLFLAGHETSASALTWATYLMANAPQVQERMHKEVVSYVADRQPALADMRHLELVRNVFRESLRLFPPVGFMARQSASACPMGKKNIEKGATVVVSPWLIQRHHALWDEPDAFNPDRYDNDASRESLKQAYLPFGMGQRVCMGAAFALQEATLILASLVREYRISALPDHEPQPVGRLTIRSANGVRLKLHQRKMTV
jgi:cytochrome P450